MAIQDLIADVSTRLTPTERRIAGLVSADPTLVAFGTVSDLATRAATSRPSVVRFAVKLGFNGYPDLQHTVRDELSRKLSSPSERIRREQSSLETVRRSIENAIEDTLDTLDDARVEMLASPIARARRVWILSGESSRAGAHALESGLTMIREGVRLVDAHASARELSGADAQDVAVVFDFARYRKHPVSIADALKRIGVPIVAITDGPLSPLASMTRTWCELRIRASGPFDSSLPAVAVSELLVARVASLLGASARERIDRLESLWTAIGTFVDDRGGPE